MKSKKLFTSVLLLFLFGTLSSHEYESSTNIMNLIITEDNFSSSKNHAIPIGKEYLDNDTCFASFSFSQTSSDGLIFEFYDSSFSPSGEIDTYTWDFGDGNFSSEINPIHTYEQEGEYIVILQIDAGDCRSFFETIIYAGENNWYSDDCMSLFWFTTNPNNYKEFYFNDFSYGNGEILFWVWDFGDGNTSILQNPLHEFEEDGEFEVTLTIITETCESEFTMELNVYESGTAGDSLMPLFIPEVVEGGDSIYFHNLSQGTITEEMWDFGDGEYSFDHDPTHRFTGGIHEVALSVWNEEESNTIVIEFNFENETKTSIEIIKTSFYPGGISSVSENITDKIKLYPNPANEYITINKLSGNTNINIFDITGKNIYKQNNCYQKNKIINIQNFPKGIYFIYINDNGNLSVNNFLKM